MTTTTTTTVLEARGLSVGYDGRTVIDSLDLAIERGTITTLVGANGSGKSTLLKAMGRILKPTAGEVLLDGRPITARSTKEVARRLAILPQNPVAPAGISVRDLVMRGRNPHQTWARPWSPLDAAVVDEALASTGLTEVADRDVAALSGGQRQRVWIALVVAQQASTLLLDEPTTFLDLTHQLGVLRLVRRLNRAARVDGAEPPDQSTPVARAAPTDQGAGATVVMVLHDLSLAARYSDRLVVLRSGRIVADGTPAAVVTPATLRTAFDLHARVVPDPVTGTPLVVPEDDGAADDGAADDGAADEGPAGKGLPVGLRDV